MLKKPCSPYDQIQPLAQKGSRFQPAQTLGKSWQVELRPGGDVYYQPVGQKTLVGTNLSGHKHIVRLIKLLVWTLVILIL